MFRVRFTAVGERFEVCEVVMNRNPQYRGNDDQDRWMLDAVFDEVLRCARR